MSIFSYLFGPRSKLPQLSQRAPKPKAFKIPAGDLVSLIPPGGACMASDHITVQGLPVGYMFRDSPNRSPDTGWIFMSGRESQEYADDPDNWGVYELNTIANYDEAIIPYLPLPVGTRLDRVPDTVQFQPVGPNDRSA